MPDQHHLTPAGYDASLRPELAERVPVARASLPVIRRSKPGKCPTPPLPWVPLSRQRKPFRSRLIRGGPLSSCGGFKNTNANRVQRIDNLGVCKAKDLQAKRFQN
jgi:hypothetical protein